MHTNMVEIEKVRHSNKLSNHKNEVSFKYSDPLIPRIEASHQLRIETKINQWETFSYDSDPFSLRKKYPTILAFITAV